MKKSNSNVALKLESWLFKVLECGSQYQVYNHIPDDATMPLIRIGDISWYEWLMAPISYKAQITITIFSDMQSNQEAIKLSDSVRKMLQEEAKLQKDWLLLEVTSNNVYQLRNQTWCSDVEIECKVWW